MEEKITLTVRALAALLEAAYNNGCLQRPWIIEPTNTSKHSKKSRHSVVDNCTRCPKNILNGGDGDCAKCTLMKLFMG